MYVCRQEIRARDVFVFVSDLNDYECWAVVRR